MDDLKERAIKLGHTPTYLETHMIDSIHCSCGWDSGHYFDGYEYAYKEWENHVKLIVEDPYGTMKPGEDLRRNRC
jgi:hypothetical protein